MLAYYGYTISPNQIETGEGFLICKNVPIARTGDMEYLAREIGLEGTDGDRRILVHRAPEEVFSERALASFEGKPATDEHPPELLTPESVTLYEKGHAQNIRRGAGEWDGYVLADLHIHDGGLIREIQRGKREISCGYECEYADNGDGTYSQKNIIGNHVAVVSRGRAGKRAAILDSDIKKKTQAPGPERKKMKKNGLLFSLFGQAARDKSPEEIEKMALDAADALEEEKAGAEGKTDAPEEEQNTKDSVQAAPQAAPGADMEALAQAIAAKLLAVLSERQEPQKDPIDAAIEKLTEGQEPGAGDEAKVVPAEEMDKGGCSMDTAVAASILKRLRPAVAAIRDEKERKAVSDALLACVTDNSTEPDISKLLKTAQKNAGLAADQAKEPDMDKVQAAYDSRNPHKKNENGGTEA